MSTTSPHMSSSGDIPAGNTKRRRRPRAAVACDSCRTRKVKCDGQHPCSSCVQASFECSFKTRLPVLYVDSGERQGFARHGRSFIPTTVHDKQQYSQTTGSNDDGIFTLASPESSHNLSVSAIAPALDQAPVVPTTSTSQCSEPSHQAEREPEGLGGINQHTEGAEFYGNTGTFYFLSQLQSRAKRRSQRLTGPGNRDRDPARVADGDSVVNLLHSSDYSVSGAQETQSISHPSTSPQAPLADHARASASTVESASSPQILRPSRGVELERECARLYFTNLHCIHPILDQASFLNRCERELWTKESTIPDISTPLVRARTRFVSLYNIVLAIGAITAGDAALTMWDGMSEYLDQASRQDGRSISENTYLPIRAAQLFFERAKFYLEDSFESSSLETAQTTFLMAIFCQNALKPHSCYMYTGMALRTALAIGIPTNLHSETSLESRLWWNLYSYEVEMCSSVGRQSFLREPRHYRIPLPHLPTQPGPSIYLINCMVGLAEILIDISANANRPDDAATLIQSSNRSFILDERLSSWKSQLPNYFNLDRSSLDEAELITKQKIVLKLRYLNARVLIHRPFLISAIAESYGAQFTAHTRPCIEAASETIRFVHNAYLYRPYFRTWWYNCTYVLDATMVLLYVILSNMSPATAESLMGDIEKSLEIFSSMKRLAVARRCTDITKEVLSIARSHRDRGEPAEQDSGADIYNETALLSYLANSTPGPLGDGSRGELDLQGSDPFASLMDTSLVFDFLNFENWTAWSDAGNVP